MVFVHVQRTNIVKERQEPFVEAFPDRYFLTIDYDDDLADYKTVNLEYSKLFVQSLRLGIADQFNQGFFSFGKTSVRKIFLEIPKPAMDIENLYVLAGGRFSCRILPFNKFASAHAESGFCMVQELFDLKISPHERWIEIQERIEYVG